MANRGNWRGRVSLFCRRPSGLQGGFSESRRAGQDFVITIPLSSPKGRPRRQRSLVPPAARRGRSRGRRICFRFCGFRLSCNWCRLRLQPTAGLRRHRCSCSTARCAIRRRSGGLACRRGHSAAGGLGGCCRMKAGS